MLGKRNDTTWLPLTMKEVKGQVLRVNSNLELTKPTQIYQQYIFVHFWNLITSINMMERMTL